MTSDPTVDVLGVPVSAISLDRALERVDDWVAAGTPQFVTFTGVHGVMESQTDPELLAIHSQAGTVSPDGMPLVWASRYAGVEDVTRVYGPDFLLAMAERSVDKGYTSFFYGGAEGVADQLAASLQERFPGFQVAGTWCPPFRPLTEDEKVEVTQMILDSGADLVWVGLSTPKQERWMAEFCPRLGRPVLFGVGAAFDIHSGNLRQAPPRLQKLGLEWAYRLAMEPKRLWRRYFYNNPRFVWALARRRPRLVEPSS
jgi:N-acetylglucosaminyldiphosphoundecaprenol N-acetyl-beta-D-mannosaminyltransferase